MKRVNILKKLANCGVIAVVRGDSAQQAIKASEAIVAGGMKGIELTFTVPNAQEAIRTLAEKHVDDEEVVIGAGTVLDATTARLAIMAGAAFIVSPCFDIETAKICNLYQIPYLPGCMTINEMKEALKAGADIVKLFPGSAFGPKIVGAFKAPLPQLNSLENMADWFKAGVVAVGVGGNLLAPLKNEDYPAITKVAEQYMAKLQEIREG